MTRQLGLFGESSVAVAQPEPKTTVRLGHQSAERPLRKRRRETLEKFCALLDELEGKDIWISTCGGSGSHFWMNYLKLERLQDSLCQAPVKQLAIGRLEILNS